MKKVLRQISILFLAISLVLIWSDCGFINNTFYQNKINSHNECSDISDHFEHSHLACFEEAVFTNNSKIKLNKSLISISIRPSFDINFTNSFISNIWQPPKIF